jgi:hypothetical protein
VAAAIVGSHEARRTLVAGWYHSDLGRPASIAELKADPGVAYWASLLDSGVKPDEVRAAILSSAEFSARFGGTAEGLVIGAYRSLLDREPNKATITAAAAQITGSAWDQHTLILSIQTIEEAALTKVAGWYRDLLGRSASIADLKTDPGVKYWSSLLGRG